MENSPTWLLAISIGPVQDFIAASRKARDLFYGSELLSSISRAVAEYLNRPQAELIFPAPDSLIQNHAVANKILVSTTLDPAALAAAARDVAQAVLDTCWNHILKEVSDRRRFPESSVDIPLGGRQIKDFLEWYAAWVPYDPDVQDTGDAKNYRNARQRVELLLAGRKALRDFGPAHGRDMRPKSSLDGSRETIVNAVDFPPVARRLKLKQGEQLDAISLIKRMEGNHRFVSTARVAIDPFLRSVVMTSDDKLAQLQELADIANHLNVTDLVERFPAEEFVTQRYDTFPFDTQLFYELSEETAVRQLDPWKPKKDSANNDQQQQRYDGLKASVVEFVDRVKGLVEGGPELPAYFAVLRADGDRIGGAIGNMDDKTGHRKLSYWLGTFAEAAEEIVAEHYGAVIYTGGDDVLAFLPLDTVLPCADVLRRRFNFIMRGALGPDRDAEGQPSADNPEYDDSLPTLSVGIAIGHYADHLQALLDRSMQAEKAAKNPHRNSLAVSLSTHSGGGDERMVVHSWNDDPVKNYWAAAIDGHRLDDKKLPGGIPGGTPYELAMLYRYTVSARNAGVFDAFPGSPATGVDQGFLKEYAIRETRRILERKQAAGGSEKIHPQTIGRIVKRMERAVDGDAVLTALRSVIDELVISRRIAPWLMHPHSGAIDLWRLAGCQLASLAPINRTEDQRESAD